MLRFLATLAGVVILHALWDASAGAGGPLVVGVLSFALLAGVTARLHRGTRRVRARQGSDL